MTTNEKRPGGRHPRAVVTADHTRPHSHPNTAEAQRLRLLNALRGGPVTTLQARAELDVMHPAARVMELREEGLRIFTAWAREPSPCGRLHRVARYVLAGGAA